MEREVDRIIVGSVDAEGFAEATLRQVWSEASLEQRARWQLILAHMLHKRYRPKLKDPTHQDLKVLKVQMDCDRARVAAQLRSRRSREVTQLELRLLLRPGQPWRVWDATVGGTSLVLTWRKRFTALFNDGGLPALERYLATLAERYPCREQGCPR
jgi:ABC-type transporter MlaC component